MVLILIAFASLSIPMSIASRGFLEADGVTHFIYAQWSLEEPHLLFNVWGRPIVTMLHALPAQLPGKINQIPIALVGVRWVSLALALGTGVVAWQIARDLGMKRPALATLFFLGQPLVFLHSFAVLTELPFAFLSLLMVRAYQKQWWWAMALLAGLLPAARPEGIGFLLVAACGLVVHKRLLELPLCLVGTILWAVGGWLTTGRPTVETLVEYAPTFATTAGYFDWLPEPIAGIAAWLPASWPYSGDSTYSPGPLMKFVGMMPAAVGPLLLPMTIVGAVVCFGRKWRDHDDRVKWVIAGLPTIVLVVHSILHALGKMASSGEVRYLIAVAPLWGIMTALGWEWLEKRLPPMRSWISASVLVVTPFVFVQLWYPVVPLKLYPDSIEALELAEWLDENVSPETPMLVSHPIVWYGVDRNPMEIIDLRSYVSATPGTVFIWHVDYSRYNADASLTVGLEEMLASGWKDETPPQFSEAFRVLVKE